MKRHPVSNVASSLVFLRRLLLDLWHHSFALVQCITARFAIVQFRNGIAEVSRAEGCVLARGLALAGEVVAGMFESDREAHEVVVEWPNPRDGDEKRNGDP